MVSAKELAWRTRWLKYLFWPFAALCLYGVIACIRSGDRRMGELVGYGLGVPFFALAPFMLHALRYREVKIFDAEGVTTRTGRRFTWDRFVKIEDHRRRRIGHNHYELTFEDGRCAIADLMADNFHEVRALVAHIEAGKNPFTGEPIGARASGQTSGSTSG